MIRANCREQLTADDFDFIVKTLTTHAKERIALTDLLTDEGSRDEILDHQVLFQTIANSPGVSKISPFLYFYTLIRNVFRESNLEDRSLADYVACMLAEFCSITRAQSASKRKTKQYSYLVDILIDSEGASSYESFLLRSHLGNYALFMSGVFPDYIYRKSTYGRKAPGIDYYEEMGSRSFRWASRHRMAARFSLVDILATLGQSFRPVRLALNKMADSHMMLDERPERLDKMLRALFYGNQTPGAN